MTNQFPPPDWYLRPDEWPYWTPNTLPSSGLMPTRPLDFPWNQRAPAWSLSAMPSSSNSGILGDFGQAGEWNDPQTTIPRQGAWDPSVPPIPFAPPAAFSLPVLPAMRTPGVNTEGYSPLYDAATREDMRPATAASFGRTAAAPQPSGWDALISPIEHLESAKYWGAAPMPSRAASEQMPSRDYYLSPVPRAPSWEAIPPRAKAEATELLPAPNPWSWSAPGGNPNVTQGTGEGDEAENIPQTLSDVTPDNYWIPGAYYAADGHHEFPQANYRRMPPETRKVFDAAKSGPLFVILDGRRHEYDRFHREYNKATGDLLERFMKGYNIPTPEQMTPDHARAVLKAIAESNDPRIQYYREFIRQLRLFRGLRGGGRGSE